MNITIHDETEKRFVFADMEPGELFQHNSIKYMTIKTSYTEGYKAVNMNTGELAPFNPKEQVQPEKEKRAFVQIGELKPGDLFFVTSGVGVIHIYRVRLRYKKNLAVLAIDIFDNDQLYFFKTRQVTPITTLDITVNGGK